MSLTTNQQLYSDEQLIFTTSNEDRRIAFGSATGTTDGIEIEFDRLTTPKTFKISPTGVNWSDGVNTYNTGLERLALVQQAFSAVELPPNATTLKINDTILVDAGIANQYTTINDGTAILSDAGVGGAVNPLFTLTNTNTGNGAVSMEIYKNKPTIPSNGDILFNQSVYGKDSFLNKQEYTRIQHTIRDITAGIEDASIEMGCFVNGSFANFLQINGNQNEVNCLKTLDMESNNILTNAKIGTRLAFPTGSYVDFANGTPDDYFRQDVDGIVYRFYDLTNTGTTTLLNKYATSEQYLKQELITPTNTFTTIIENDLTHHRIKLEETLSGANTEITKDEIVIDSGSGLSAKLTPSTLQFNNISVLPRRSFTSTSFSVFGSPTGAIFNVGTITDMTASTKWKVEISFSTTATNNRNVITYLVKDTANTLVDTNSALSYSVGGLSTAPAIDPNGITPMGQIISLTDTFEVSASASGSCEFIVSGGTYDSSTWSGTANISVVLTYIDY